MRKERDRKGNVRIWKTSFASLSWVSQSTRFQGTYGRDDQAFRDCFRGYHRAGYNLSSGSDSLFSLFLNFFLEISCNV